MSSCSNKLVYFNNPHPKQNQHHVNKNDNKNQKLIELARCCICFENYSINARAPICVPCGHSFCTDCIRKLVHGNLVCCCICRKVTFFGPKELGKNIQLLDVLESLGLLDTDDKTVNQPSSSRSPPVFPENVIEGVEDRDMMKYFEFCFNFIKKFYENKQENMITNLAMVSQDGHLEITHHANRMFLARNRLSESMDDVLIRFNECIQTMNSCDVGPVPPLFVQNYEYGGEEYDGAVFFNGSELLNDDYNDPFGIEELSARAFLSLGPNQDHDFSNRFEDREMPAQPSLDRFGFHPEYDDGFHHHYDSHVQDEQADEFRPANWAPLSKLFNLPRNRY